MIKRTVILAIIVTLTACVQPPRPLRGSFSDISPKAYQQKPVKDLLIRWTGFVIDVENKADHSCLTIMAKVSDMMAKPSRNIRLDLGRFIACKPNFLEPEFFKHKAVTITGPVKKLVNKKIDELDYAYPLVDAEVIYVW